jgi:hypothetical protein
MVMLFGKIHVSATLVFAICLTKGGGIGDAHDTKSGGNKHILDADD